VEFAPPDDPLFDELFDDEPELGPRDEFDELELLLDELPEEVDGEGVDATETAAGGPPPGGPPR